MTITAVRFAHLRLHTNFNVLYKIVITIILKAKFKNRAKLIVEYR